MTPDDDFFRIWHLISDLAEARWTRVRLAPNLPDALLVDEMYPPEGVEEGAIWSELTAPRNYAALRRYVEFRNPATITEYALRLHEALVADATRRMLPGG